jgi:hypothetical protein
VPLTIWLVAGLNRGRIVWQPIVICLLALAFFLLWLRSYKLVLSDHGISYRSLFRGTISLVLSEIEKVHVQVECSISADRYRPTIRMIFEPKAFVRKPPIVVNLKLFSKTDLSQLNDLIDSKLKGKTGGFED